MSSFHTGRQVLLLTFMSASLEFHSYVLLRRCCLIPLFSQVFELTLQLRAMQKRVDEAEKKAAAYNEQLKAMFTREAEARAR